MLRRHILSSHHDDVSDCRSDHLRAGTRHQQWWSTNHHRRSERVVTGSASVLNDLVVTVNFGEVSPLNPNAAVKVVVPIALRSNQPYQVSVSLSGFTNNASEGLQPSDVGLGIQNLRLLGGAGKICNQSTHIIRSPFGNDPATAATVGTTGRVVYPSSFASLSGATVILSGPELSKTTAPNASKVTVGFLTLF